MNKGRWMITLGAFISISFLGMSRSFLGTALPAIRSSLDLTFLEAGTFTTLLQLGFALAVFVGGPISDVFKKSIILMIGLLILGINLIFFGLSQWFWVSLFVIALIGIGGGLIEASSNPLLVLLYPGRGSVVMNLHHFFFAIGSLAGPLIMGTVLAISLPWQWAYIGFGFFVLLILLFLLSQQISSPKTNAKLEMRVMGNLMRQRTFLSLFFVMFLGNGVQNGIVYWTVTFLMETRGFSISLASLSLSLFLFCLAGGRLIASCLLTRIHDALYLIILFSMLLVSMAVALYVPGKWVIPALAICGLAMSGVFPTLMGMTGRVYSETPGTAMGLTATGAGLGSMTIPWLMSLVSQFTDLRLGFLSFEIYLIVALILICVNFKRLKLA